MNPEDFKEAFREEARDILATLESKLMQWESDPTNQDVLAAVFRAFHTIKGSAAMFGFEDVSAYTHKVESALDQVRSGQVQATPGLIAKVLQARDRISQMIEGVDPADMSDIPWDAPQAMPAKNAEERIFRIKWTPATEAFRAGIDVAGVLDSLQALGQVSALCVPGSMPAWEDFNPLDCWLGWEVFVNGPVIRDQIADLFFFAAPGEIDIKEISVNDREQRLGEILLEKGLVTEDLLKEALHSQKRIGEFLQERAGVSQVAVQTALEEQRILRSAAEKNSSAQPTIRIHSHKLDELVDLVGEMVTIQARFMRTASLQNNPELVSLAEQMERLVTSLRDNTLSLRMLPIATTFQRFERLVRDLGRDLAKEVKLETEGGDTELDKTVIERLADPLVHLLRNALDHGIEGPSVREAAGKPRVGTIRLAATQTGDSVLITISDDGKGLDREKIKGKAFEKGLLKEGAEPTEAEILNLIFQPGFSTSANVTSVSGRGVGMDVVKKELEALGGSIAVTTTPGKGSVFQLKVPLTLAIIEGMMVKIGDATYVVPHAAIESCLEFDPADLLGQRRLLRYRDTVIPLVDVREFFGIAGSIPERRQLVVVQANGTLAALLVDTVVGAFQTVIKSLGAVFRGIGGLGGATILGDGSIALLLDVSRILEIQEGARV